VCCLLAWTVPRSCACKCHDGGGDRAERRCGRSRAGGPCQCRVCLNSLRCFFTFSVCAANVARPLYGVVADDPLSVTRVRTAKGRLRQVAPRSTSWSHGGVWWLLGRDWFRRCENCTTACSSRGYEFHDCLDLRAHHSGEGGE
jgi:hypothetical protein